MNKSKIILIVLIAAAFVSVAVFLTNSITNSGGKVIYEQAAGQRCVYDESNGDLVISGQEGLTIVDKNGGTKLSLVKSFQNPVYCGCGDYKLFYDKKGTTLMYFKGEGEQKTITTDLPIINAVINSVGNFAIATMETGYKGKIEVYDHSGEAVYKWQIGNSYVVDMDISPDCKYMAVVLLDMTGQTAGARTVMINLDKAEIVSDSTLSDNLPIDVKFIKSGLALTVTDVGVYAIDKSGKEKWDYQFGEKILESYKICDNGSAVFEFHGASNNSVIEMYTSGGKKSGEYVSQNTIAAIDASEHTVAATDGKFIKLLNWHGGDKGVIKSQTDLKDIVILDASCITAIGNNSVEAVKY